MSSAVTERRVTAAPRAGILRTGDAAILGQEKARRPAYLAKGPHLVKRTAAA